MLAENEHDIASKVISIICNDVALAHPIYRHDLNSDEAIECSFDSLSLVTIWGENAAEGSFNTSINAPLVKDCLLLFMPQDDPSFRLVFKTIVDGLREAVNNSIIETCEITGLIPSVAFSREAYLEMVASADAQPHTAPHAQPAKPRLLKPDNAQLENSSAGSLVSYLKPTFVIVGLIIIIKLLADFVVR